MVNRWLRTLNGYFEPRVVSIFFLGFSSGLPFLLILATFSVWLAESGISKTQIGILAWVTLPYSLKFLLAPFVDRYQIPFMCRFFGQRRGWMLTSQLCLMVVLVLLGVSNPSENLLLTSIFALTVGICSATQDIVIEAFRIEVLPKSWVGYGAGASVLGYRLGMLVSGAGALYLATFLESWAITYAIMAGFVLVGIIATLMSKEPKHKKKSLLHKSTISLALNQNKGGFHQLETLFLQPLLHFIKRKDWILILPFIVMYKVGDTVLNSMSMPFLIEIGFSKVEIAHVAKTFGISAMVIGGLIGGIFLTKYSLRRNLIICTSLQVIASIFFLLQAIMGHHVPFLFITMGIENLTCGLGQVALITYLSTLCEQPNTATHYAMLSSFASFSRVILSMIAGWLADQLIWPDFFTVITLGCLPGLLVLLIFNHHFTASSPETRRKAA